MTAHVPELSPGEEDIPRVEKSTMLFYDFLELWTRSARTRLHNSPLVGIGGSPQMA